MLAYGRKIIILPFRRETNAPVDDLDRFVQEITCLRIYDLFDQIL